jgi:hypothetical protein
MLLQDSSVSACGGDDADDADNVSELLLSFRAIFFIDKTFPSL